MSYIGPPGANFLRRFSRHYFRFTSLSFCHGRVDDCLHNNMSEGYASRLKDYPNKGKCGLPEVLDTRRSLSQKVNKLAKLIEASTRVVVLTGAGISTSSGIPDFRGPSGIWTLEQKEQNAAKKRKIANEKASISTSKNESTKRPTRQPVVMDFSQAKPSRTHRIITKLTSTGHIRFCITQNVDGLHRRSGLSREKHAVLHGCVFTEKCEDCQAEHFRDKDVGGMSFRKTGRKCDNCGGDLRDTLLDWEDALPEDDFARATEECEKADLAICLGTSLRIEPAGSLPTYAKKFVIINMQETPYDSQADLVIRGRVDDVMQGVMEHLGLGNWEDCDTAPPIERMFLPTKCFPKHPQDELDRT